MAAPSSHIAGWTPLVEDRMVRKKSRRGGTVASPKRNTESTGSWVGLFDSIRKFPIKVPWAGWVGVRRSDEAMKGDVSQGEVVRL